MSASADIAHYFMKKTAYLGIFGPGPNSSAAVVSNNEIIAWAEEERFNRIKTSPNSYPARAIEFCVKEARNRGFEIEKIGYAWECENYAELATTNLEETIAQFPGETDHISRLAQSGLNALYNPVKVRQDLSVILRKMGIGLTESNFKFYSHHLSHVASAIHCSGFDEAIVIVNDGVGEVASSSLVYVDRSGNMQELASEVLPNTLGGFYATITEYLGFKAYVDEGKTMGLAAYGAPNSDIMKVFDEMVQCEHTSFNYTVNPRFRYSGKRTHGSRFTDLMVEKLGPSRVAGVSAMQDPYPAIAYAAQKKLEEVLFAQLRYAASLNMSKNICFAGGVHMNCKANGLIGESDLFENYFFQPAASDNGVCLGAAILAQMDDTGSKPDLPVLEHLYFGPSFTDDEIEKVLKTCKISYQKSEDIAADVAQFIADNQIVGWFQGRMEVGARALGGRSILANPLNPDARDHVNKHVKNRESWRPFCPSLKKESFKGYFDTPIEKSPFMIVACRIEEEFKTVLPSCVHVDGTVRPQTVNKDVNPLYWSVMNEFEKITGQSIIVNTSFNVQGEPIVMRPEEAIRCFYGSGMDVLAMGSFLIKKNGIISR